MRVIGETVPSQDLPLQAPKRTRRLVHDLKRGSINQARLLAREMNDLANHMKPLEGPVPKTGSNRKHEQSLIMDFARHRRNVLHACARFKATNCNIQVSALWLGDREDSTATVSCDARLISDAFVR